MIHYLIDSSAVWRVIRSDEVAEGWSSVITEHGIGSCPPQRAEFRRSARNLGEFEDMNAMFESLYPDVGVPKNAWRWIEAAQYQLIRRGAHQAMSPVDLLICATAAANGLTILHDDNDFTMAAGFLTDVTEHSILDVPV